jgi:hypothetical protein
MLFDNRLLIFSSNSLNAYNLTDKQFETVDKIVHIPLTKSIAQSAERAVDTKNALTDSELYAYLYQIIDENGVDTVFVNEAAYNDVLYLENENGDKWYFKFTDRNKFAITERHKLSDFEFSADDADKIKITYSELGTAVLFKKTLDKDTQELYYSNDGRVFQALQQIVESNNTQVIYDASISKDGYHVCALTQKNAYVKTIVSTGVHD